MSTQPMPPLPKSGEMISDDVLQANARTVLSLARGFAGTSDPTVIWTAMIQDNWTAYSYYRELEEKDDDIAAAMEMLKLAVLNRDRCVDPADDSSQALEIAQFVQQQFDQVPNFHEVLEAMLDAPAYGVTFQEMIFDVSAGQVSLVDIKDRPQELFSFNPMYLLQTGPLRVNLNAYSIVDGGELVQEDKFLVFSFRPRNGNRRGRPLLRRVFWPSWFKRQTMRFWLRFAEKGPGTAAVMYPSGGSPDEKDKALAAAEAIVSSIAIAIPDNFKMVEQLLTSARTQNPAVYKQLIDDCKYSIARSIVGQTLTSFGQEGGTGSKALGLVHADMFYLKEMEVALKLQNVINTQAVRPLVMWNYGPNAPMPKFKIVTENEENLAQRILIDRNLQSMGLSFTENYLREKYSVPEPRPTDVIVTPSATEAPVAIGTGAAQIPSFSDAEAVHNGKEVRQLMDALGMQLGDLYKKRIHEIADAVKGGSL